MKRAEANPHQTGDDADIVQAKLPGGNTVGGQGRLGVLAATIIAIAILLCVGMVWIVRSRGNRHETNENKVGGNGFINNVSSNGVTNVDKGSIKTGISNSGTIQGGANTGTITNEINIEFHIHLGIDTNTLKSKWTPSEAFKNWTIEHKTGQHDTVQAEYTFEGKSVIVVPVQRYEETRITGNIDFDRWQPNPKSPGTIRVLLAIDKGNRELVGLDLSTLSLQQKWDAKWAEDPNKGDVFKLGQINQLDGGHDKYYAKRGDGDWGSLSGKAFLVIADANITEDQIKELPGFSVLK